LLAGEPYGLVLLWLLGIGFTGYALWRLSEAAYGVTGEGADPAPRLKALMRALVYAFFAYLTFQVISGHRGSQSRQEQDLSARLIHDSAGGRWIVGIAGVVIMIVGIVLIIEGIRRRFLKYLRTSKMSRRTRRIVERLGMIGTAARGAVIGLAGILVIDAAVTFKPSKAGGLDKALLTLRNQPFGEFLLIIAALGLLTCGIYGLCEARWRRVKRTSARS
jgi:ABC-type Fe3+ transport system permease subunit